MCFCNFATGYCLTLKTQSVRHVIKLMFKVQISPDQPTSNTNRIGVLRPSLTVLSMVMPIANCLPFFFRIDSNFYQTTLPHTLCRGPNESLMEKIKRNQS